MKGNEHPYPALLRTLGGGIVVVFGVLSILGSGGGGGGDRVANPSGQTPTGIRAYNFTAANSLGAAQAAASTLAFFSDFSTLDQTILTTLLAADPANSPFDLALCVNSGTSKLSWIDSDHNGKISIGDSATLQFVACDLDGSGATTSGTAKFGVTSVNGDPLPNSIGLNVGVNVAISDTGDSTSYIANFRESSSTTDNIHFTKIYMANDTSQQQLTVVKNGSTRYQFGCFSVTKSFSVADSAGTYQLQPAGVINLADAILSFAGGPAPSFISDKMEAGTTRLLSLSLPECTTLGVPNGIGDSDGSYLDMEALGGGSMRLHTYDAANVEQSTQGANWDALLI